MGIYEFAILGSVSPEQRQCLTDAIGQMIYEFGLAIGTEVKIYDAETLADRNRSSAFAAVYFGGVVPADVEAAASAFAESVPIIPVVKNIEQFSAFIPDFLQAINGYCLKK